jgi:hypothetical protein
VLFHFLLNRPVLHVREVPSGSQFEPDFRH